MATLHRSFAPAGELPGSQAHASDFATGMEQGDVPGAAPAASVRNVWSLARRADQARADYQTCIAVLVFYLIDAAFLALYCVNGVGRWASVIAFVCVGTVVAGGGAWFVRRHGAGSLEDQRLVALQAGSALTLVLIVALLDPAFLSLMLLTVVVIIPTAALRIPPRDVLVICILAALASIAVVAAHGGRLTIPAETRAQQILSGLFLLWTLAKSASLNVVGMTFRLQLDESHARLAAALVRIEELAQMDDLTGLPNRRRVLAALAEERERHRRSGVGFSVAMLDVDYFKRINDQHGHAVGDEVLKVIASLMKGALRKVDLVGRVGGEEFLMIFAGTAGSASAHLAADRVRLAIQDHPWASVAPELRVTASIGVAVDVSAETPADLVARADRGLYEAKRHGRNQVVLADEHCSPPA